ncbi:hypothetical protein [Nocardioides korecus]
MTGQQTDEPLARPDSRAAGPDGSGRPVREGREPRSWGTPNAALALLLVALLALAALFLLRDPASGSGGADAALASARQRAVVAAAKDEATAFLTVNYQSTPVVARRVLSGATGGFAREYRAGLGELTRRARTTRAVARPTLRAVGVDRLGATRATVLVAADAQVSNRSIRGQDQSRYYRLRLELVRRDGRWLTTDLRFVD